MATVQELTPARPQRNGSYTRTGPYAFDGGAGLDQDGPFTAISTYTGHGFDFTDPSTWTYDCAAQLLDIGTALSNVTRYGGHSQFYSVAEHSLRVADWLQAAGYSTQMQLLGLWHDATEAYIGDFPRPLKKLIALDGEPIETYEDRLMLALVEHFNLATAEEWRDSKTVIKEADYAVYQMERSERPTPASSGKYAATPSVANTLWQLRHSALTAA